MKIIAAAAASLMSLLPAQCQTTPERPTVTAPVPAPNAYQSAYGVSINTQAACSSFSITLTNSTTNRGRVQATVFVNGSAGAYLFANPGEVDSEHLYFPANSGDYAIKVGWPGGYSNYKVWTNCAP